MLEQTIPEKKLDEYNRKTSSEPVDLSSNQENIEK